MIVNKRNYSHRLEGVKMRGIYLRKNDKGQSLVEFAFVFPILLLLIFGIIQFGVILGSRVATTYAANEGVRMAAVGKSAPEVKNRITSITSLVPFLRVESDSIEVWPEEPASRLAHGEVMVEFPATIHIFTPFGFSGNSLGLHSSASMLYESGEYIFGDVEGDFYYIDIFKLEFDKPSDTLKLTLSISDSDGVGLDGEVVIFNLYRKVGNNDILVDDWEMSGTTGEDGPGTISLDWSSEDLVNGRYRAKIAHCDVNLVGSLESNYVNVN